MYSTSSFVAESMWVCETKGWWGGPERRETERLFKFQEVRKIILSESCTHLTLGEIKFEPIIYLLRYLIYFLRSLKH